MSICTASWFAGTKLPNLNTEMLRRLAVTATTSVTVTIIDRLAAHDTGPVEGAGDDGGMTERASTRGYDPVGSKHSPDVLRASRRTKQDNGLTSQRSVGGSIGVKNGGAAGMTRR